MLNWVASSTSADKDKSQQYTNAAHNLIAKYNTGKGLPTDSINKICDLEGNLKERTQEAWYNNTRVIRGGSFSTDYGIGARRDYSPTNYGDNFGTRLTLYIK